jgi:predicted nucleotidyltransferase
MTPDVVRSVAAVGDIARRLGVEAVLVGATASELAVKARTAIPAPRRSNDADFALRLPDWNAFERMKTALMSAGFEPHPRIEHRLTLGAALVDLIPFGPGVSDAQGRITWPGSGFVMTVIGFEEACGRSKVAALPAGGRIRYVDAPEFILLKIIAFMDRQSRGDEKHRSDGEDIYFWMKHFPGGLEEPRCFGLAGRNLKGIDYQNAGAALLGMDVRVGASGKTDQIVRRFMVLAGEEYGPFINAVVLPGFDEGRPVALSFISAFRVGYEA